MEDEGTCECCQFFKDTLLEAQNQFMLFKGKESRWNKRLPWLKCELLSLLKTKREAYQRWKTHGELQGHCQGEQMQLEKQKLSSNWNWPGVKSTKKDSSGT